MKWNAWLERACMKITHFHQDMNAYFRCWTWRLYLPQRHRPQCEGQCPQTGPSHSCPRQCDRTFNDLTERFNWVENVQVCRAQLHLSQETKGLARYSHIHSWEGCSGFTHRLERRLKTYKAYTASVVFTHLGTDPPQSEPSRSFTGKRHFYSPENWNVSVQFDSIY